MKILAIETSCDETAAAVVADGRQVLGNVVASHLDLHRKTGGVVPEVSSREHVVRLNAVVDEALAQAGLQLTQLDAVAATLGPGLIGSLAVGATAAKTLAMVTGLEFRAVNHLWGHVASNYLTHPQLEPPYLCLLASGGHTMLIAVEAYDRLCVLGQTLDDAAGEAWDKVARLLGLPYPGGPALDKLVGEAALVLDENPLPSPKTEGAWDFSFSGLKTAVLRAFEKQGLSQVALATAFQQRAVAHLVQKTMACAQANGFTSLALAGGVAANGALRRAMQAACEEKKLGLYLPELGFCGDNAAMIASAAYYNPIATGDKAMALGVFSRLGDNNEAYVKV